MKIEKEYLFELLDHVNQMNCGHLTQTWTYFYPEYDKYKIEIKICISEKHDEEE